MFITGEWQFGQHHVVDSANQIGGMLYDGQIAVPQVVYDANRNLRYDGRFLYDYDAWGRLIQVRDADGTVAFDGDEVTLGSDNGPLCIQYAYDAVGRLMRKRVVRDMAFTGEGDGSCETPLEGCSTAVCGCDQCEGVEEPCMRCGATPAVIRFTDHYYYYYDGVRRIQEGQ
ncbi:MAG: RHS repeat protein [Planctomycetes bacterium]|nr:RHS repeat protein [Planctomycetota bacterium]